MADIIDEAQEQEQLIIIAALSNRTAETMKFTGRCYWCGEVLAKGNFCAGDSCAEDYERRMKADKQRGAA
ncbi:hypothetical protein [Serratia ficaria]|uniref:hypothetical protein n=1 Tax=Serratia ficaria TaxID=61651 RepID=UPI002178FD37|nr:hypothetical protein [Serratia ficaria]CAI1018858.1 Uncharacterised protein [Serratia ficaria]CAI1991634.1 Uncharacterised protein [Serratia ficaria]